MFKPTGEETGSIRPDYNLKKDVNEIAAEHHIQEDGYESISAKQLIYWAYKEKNPDKSRKLLKRARIIELRYRQALLDFKMAFKAHYC